MTARERFFKKLQQQQNPQRTLPLDGSAAADINAFRQQMAALAQQISQWFDGSGIDVEVSTRYLHDLSTLGYSLNSGICRYDIPAIRLQNGERSVNIVPQQLWNGVEKGVVSLSLDTHGGTATRQVYYLSLAPDDGWMIRKAHQPPEARLNLTEDRFFMAVDSLA
ncbi:hypothetical protein ACKLKD_04755 [Klebsiella sp. 10982]|uniref:Uncharacterized protein n=1 Tax=Klebsiella quasivariicola TaxID=2026240 RepID=A0A223UC40_9ENTR|nr:MULTISPECIES: hypothetical protein [Klebsiella]MEA1148450.1 hypothetical protein [Klebsiella pneumoniae]QBL49764.1 hypothetical protein BMD99_015170 [Klebsiella sp. PO552]ASV20599.1 hypothetical protein B8P98_15550 [Klebsiella quasivariicola]MBF7821079.1 hypothetical protein [Klebsiella quasivariicola]MBK2370627.1 hypothetical protein [Klebsiella quasivariicola]